MRPLYHMGECKMLLLFRHYKIMNSICVLKMYTQANNGGVPKDDFDQSVFRHFSIYRILITFTHCTLPGTSAIAHF